MTLRPLSGRFYRAIRADRVDAVLEPPSSTSAGRYHRPGQPALYISGTAEWASGAVAGYVSEEGRPRVIVPLDMSEALLLDQRDAVACAALGIDCDAANHPWREALAAGEEPPSWHIADLARAAGADGLVDRSRQIPGGWHIVLFAWNAPGTPIVTVAGPPISSSSEERG